MSARRRQLGFAALLAAFFLALPLRPAAAEALAELRVGVLKFGTVNWQLDSLIHHGFDRQEGLTVTPLLLASKNATAVALQAGEADFIVSDWIWVLRQRAAGARFLFHPYSTALGALMVRAEGAPAGIAQLAGKRIGIAGGPLDKSWLLLRSWAATGSGIDLAEAAEPVYAAPPLLNEHLTSGDLDALLTFWPYAARLQAAGFKEMIAVSDILKDFGIVGRPALVGYVFPETLAAERREALSGFFRALEETNALLARSDAEWERLRPLMQAASDAEFEALKAGYRSGIPEAPSATALADARRLFDILAETGGADLVGAGTRFDPEIFWAAGER